MYFVRITSDSGVTWNNASMHSELGDAQLQMARFIADNGIDPANIKVSLKHDDGSYTDV